jgi:hypothetical protein
MIGAMNANKIDLKHAYFLERVAKSWQWYLTCKEEGMKFDAYDCQVLGKDLMYMAISHGYIEAARYGSWLHKVSSESIKEDMRGK